MNVRHLLLSLALPAVLAAPAQAAKPFTARDLATLDRVSSPVLSPDGQRLVFAVREVDYDANKARTGLWIADTAAGAGAPARFSGDQDGSSPAFSPDGRYVYFLSGKSGSSQLWRQAVGAAAAQQVSALPLDVASFKLSPDGQAVAFVLEVFTDCGDLACTTSRLASRAADKASGHAHDQVFVRHWDTWSDGRRNQLFAGAFGKDGKLSGEPVRISAGIDGDTPSKPFGGSEEYAWAPDGQSLVFSAKRGTADEAWTTNFDLYRGWVRARRAPQNLTAGNPAYDSGPAFSADGKTLYYRAMKRPGYEADRLALMAMDLGSGESREVAPGWDRSADATVLSADGKTLYTTADHLGRKPLFAVDVASGKVTELVPGGTVTGFDVAGGRLAYVVDSLASPPQAFVARTDGSEARAVSRNTDAAMAELAFGDYEQFTFTGWNGETVHGYVVKPVGYEEGKTYPVAFLIHGGPQGSFGDHFHFRWNPQTYAGAGFAAVMIDFHGSTGYGQAFTDAISGHWGDRPFEDLQKGWAAAQAKYPFLDGRRACALGGSYGGYMVNWIAGNWPDGFRCLVSHSGIFDNRSMGYTTEELWFNEWETGGKPWEVADNIERFNPVNHVAAWKAPMLVVHGELDYRVPFAQGLGAFTALQRRGIPSRFLVFPDENHWILKPQNSVQWHREVNDWLTRWTAE